MKHLVGKIINLLIIISIFTTIGCDTSSGLEPGFEKVFYKLYGIQGDQVGKDLKQLPDGSGYIIIGNSDTTGFSNGTIDQDIYLVRTDAQGNEMYHRTFGGNRKDESVAIEILPSGEFLFVVNSENTNQKIDAVVYKVPDDEFAVYDSAVFGNPLEDNIINGLSLISNGIIICGTTTDLDRITKPNPPSDLRDIYTVKMDFNFVEDPVWTNVYGYSGDDEGIKVVELSSGSFAFFGTTDTPTPANSQTDLHTFFTFPTSVNGLPNGILSQYGTAGEEFAKSVTVTSVNSFAMIGTSMAATSSIYVTFLRSDLSAPSGNGKSINVSNTEGISIYEATGGGFIITGNQIVSPENKDIYLAKIDNEGIVIWSRTFGTDGLDEAGSLIQSQDGGIVLTGSFQLENQFKMVLIKAGPDGEMNF
ncbi:MAG TPA: hypothetical protein VGA21_10895 [Cyclobacteriaceae bacterium]